MDHIRTLHYYLSFRTKSQLQYLLKRPIKINHIITYIILVIFCIFFTSTILFYYFNGNQLLHNQTNIIYTFWFFGTILISFSGLEQSKNRLYQSNLHLTDYRLLLTVPISHFKIVCVKVYETVFLRQITVSLFYFFTTYIVFHNVFTYNPFLAFIFSIVLIVNIHLLKIILFFVGISRKILYSFIYTGYVLSMFLFALIVLCYVSRYIDTLQGILFYDYIINIYSTVMHYLLYGLKIIEYPIIVLTISIVTIFIWSGILYGYRNISLYEMIEFKEPITPKNYDHFKDFFSHKDVLSNLLWIYLFRQKGKQAALLFFPLFFGCFSLINIYIFLSFMVEKSYLIRGEYSFLIALIFMIRILVDNFALFSSIDFHGLHLKNIKIAETASEKLVKLHIKSAFIIEAALLTIFIIASIFYFDVALAKLLIYYVHGLFIIITFNLYYFLGSCTFPNFYSEDISKLPSLNARIVANVLMTFQIILFFAIKLQISSEILFHSILLLFHVVAIFIVYKHVCRKLSFISFE